MVVAGIPANIAISQTSAPAPRLLLPAASESVVGGAQGQAR